MSIQHNNIRAVMISTGILAVLSGTAVKDRLDTLEVRRGQIESELACGTCIHRVGFVPSLTSALCHHPRAIYNTFYTQHLPHPSSLPRRGSGSVGGAPT